MYKEIHFDSLDANKVENSKSFWNIKDIPVSRIKVRSTEIPVGWFTSIQRSIRQSFFELRVNGVLTSQKYQGIPSLNFQSITEAGLYISYFMRSLGGTSPLQTPTLSRTDVGIFSMDDNFEEQGSTITDIDIMSNNDIIFNTPVRTAWRYNSLKHRMELYFIENKATPLSASDSVTLRITSYDVAKCLGLVEDKTYTLTRSINLKALNSEIEDLFDTPEESDNLVGWYLFGEVAPDITAPHYVYLRSDSIGKSMRSEGHTVAGQDLSNSSNILAKIPITGHRGDVVFYDNIETNFFTLNQRTLLNTVDLYFTFDNYRVGRSFTIEIPTRRSRWSVTLAFLD